MSKSENSLARLYCLSLSQQGENSLTSPLENRKSEGPSAPGTQVLDGLPIEFYQTPEALLVTKMLELYAIGLTAG